MDFSRLVATLALSHVTVWRLWAVVKAKADASSSASLIVLLGQSQLTGCLDKVSGITCFTPDTCIIVNLYCNVFSVKLQSVGFGMSLRDHSVKIWKFVINAYSQVSTAKNKVGGCL